MAAKKTTQSKKKATPAKALDKKSMKATKGGITVTLSNPLIKSISWGGGVGDT